MNIDLTTPTTVPGRRWRKRAAAAATCAVLIGAGIFGVTAASAAGTSPSPAAGTSAASGAAAGTSAAGHHAQRPEARLLRRELRVVIEAKAGFGDRAHVVAFALIHHRAAFARLPEQLKTDLTSLEAAPAGSRDAAAALVGSTAVNGGYGAAIQKEAKAVTARIAAAAAAPEATAPATAAP